MHTTLIAFKVNEETSNKHSEALFLASAEERKNISKQLNDITANLVSHLAYIRANEKKTSSSETLSPQLDETIRTIFSDDVSASSPISY